MIELYSCATPNGQKIHIMLEETGLPYRVHWVDIDRGDQFDPEFLKISPNNKIPAMVDSDGPEARPLSMFESGSILIYLAEKSGRFLPDAPEKRWDVLQCLFWQVGGFGPMLGQAHHFNAYAPARPDGAVVLPYAQERYTSEASRLYRVLDTQLAAHEYVAADCYSIADIAIFPWCRLFARQGQRIEDTPHVKRWFDEIAGRPAVARDMDELEDQPGEFTTEEWEVSFGARQREQR